MDGIDAGRFIYAFTGQSKDEYLDYVIKKWEEYLAAGGDPDKYMTAEADKNKN